MTAKDENLQIIDMINEREADSIGTATLTGETYYDGDSTWYEIEATELDTTWFVTLAPKNKRLDPPYEVAENIDEINAIIR